MPLPPPEDAAVQVSKLTHGVAELHDELDGRATVQHLPSLLRQALQVLPLQLTEL